MKVAFTLGFNCWPGGAEQIYESNRIPHFSLGTRSSGIAKNARFVFQMLGSDLYAAGLAVDLVEGEFGGKRVALVHDRSYALLDSVRDLLHTKNVDVRLESELRSQSGNLQRVIRDLGLSDIDVVLYLGAQDQTELTSPDFRGFSADSKLKVIGIDPTGVRARLFNSGQVKPLHNILVTPITPVSPKVAAVMDSIRGDVEHPLLALYAYASVQLWASVAERVGTLEANVIAVEMRNSMTATIVGDVRFDEAGNRRTPLRFEILSWEPNGVLRMPNPDPDCDKVVGEDDCDTD